MSLLDKVKEKCHSTVENLKEADPGKYLEECAGDVKLVYHLSKYRLKSLARSKFLQARETIGHAKNAVSNAVDKIKNKDVD